MRKAQYKDNYVLITEDEIANFLVRFDINNYILADDIYTCNIACTYCTHYNHACETCQCSVFMRNSGCAVLFRDAYKTYRQTLTMDMNKCWFKESDLVEATNALNAIKNYWANLPEVQE